LFADLGLTTRLQDVRADVRDRQRLLQEVTDFEPEFVFHLAAQPLVRASYESPVETYDVNVMGTVNLLDAVRRVKFPCAVVIITTDKCYENREWPYGYRENDAMGGADPYSSSKGMAELAVAAWRRSYCRDGRVRLASARAGNVIGGGDWAVDRIVPDCVRAQQAGVPLQVRNPSATRPWQHVLDPLHGYLQLAARLDVRRPADQTDRFADGFNFGPETDSNRAVSEVVTGLQEILGGSWECTAPPQSLHEAHLLHLCIDRARHLLGWRPVWNFTTALRQTAAWYQARLTNGDVAELCDRQLSQFVADAGC
jgi:CDP-glucose 4,6-dehydratase